MLKKTLIWFALLTTAVFATSSNVVTLNTTQEFDDAINTHDLILMKFFDPGCGHCKALMPEYELAATLLKQDDITLAEIDCTQNEHVCSRFSLTGYPTLQIFRKGRASDIYPHERTSNSIVKFMKKHMSPGLSLLQDKDSLDQLKKDEPLLVVAYIDPSDQSTLNQWRILSDRLMDDFAFACITDNQLAKSQNISNLPTIVLYKHFDHLQDVYTDTLFQEDAIEDFVKLNAVPILDDIRPEIFMDYVDANRPLVYIFSDSQEQRDELHNTFLPIAQNYKGKFSFVHIDGIEYASQAEFLSLSQPFPAMAVHNFKTGARFPLDHQDINDTQAIRAFLDNVHENKLQPAIKSQQAPSSSDGEDDAAVKVVVGNNFENVVMDTSKDVFIEIYAPWCGHCQALAPTWQQLGELVQGHDDGTVVVAKMDGTVNDVPVSAGLQVTGYPTIRFFKANGTMIDYRGQRTLHDFVDFLNQHASNLNIDLESLPIVKRSDDSENAVSEKHDEL